MATGKDNTKKDDDSVVQFKDIKIGDAFYLGSHRLVKTGEDSAKGVNFSKGAVVSRRPPSR